MPRNTTGGTGHKARANKQQFRKEITLNVEAGEGFYGEVMRALGDNTFEVKLQDLTTTQCNIPGRMRKKQWIKIGDKVLVTADKTEIVKIVRDTDKDAQEAKHALRKTSARSALFGNDCDNVIDNDDNDIDTAIQNLDVPIVATVINENKAEMVTKWRRADKERDQERRQHRDTEKYSAECSNANNFLENL